MRGRRVSWAWRVCVSLGLVGCGSRGHAPPLDTDNVGRPQIDSGATDAGGSVVPRDGGADADAGADAGASGRGDGGPSDGGLPGHPIVFGDVADWQITDYLGSFYPYYNGTYVAANRTRKTIDVLDMSAPNTLEGVQMRLQIGGNPGRVKYEGVHENAYVTHTIGDGVDPAMQAFRWFDVIHMPPGKPMVFDSTRDRVDLGGVGTDFAIDTGGANGPEGTAYVLVEVTGGSGRAVIKTIDIATRKITASSPLVPDSLMHGTEGLGPKDRLATRNGRLFVNADTVSLVSGSFNVADTYAVPPDTTWSETMFMVDGRILFGNYEYAVINNVPGVDKIKSYALPYIVKDGDGDLTTATVKVRDAVYTDNISGAVIQWNVLAWSGGRDPQACLSVAHGPHDLAGCWSIDDVGYVTSTLEDYFMVVYENTAWMHGTRHDPVTHASESRIWRVNWTKLPAATPAP